MRYYACINLMNIPKNVKGQLRKHIAIKEKRIDMANIFDKTAHLIINRYVSWRAFNKACNEMYLLSDATLNDIGIHRSQIKSFVSDSMKQNDNTKQNKQSAA